MVDPGNDTRNGLQKTQDDRLPPGPAAGDLADIDPAELFDPEEFGVRRSAQREALPARKAATEMP